MDGLSTIRAFGSEKSMLRETIERIHINTRAWIKNHYVDRWMGLRLDFTGAFLVGGTCDILNS